MLASERERIILEHLRKHRNASTDTIAKLTDSSLATARRDLKHMSLKGLIDKRHGGASAIDAVQKSGGNNAALGEDPHLQEKEQIAAVAAGLVKSGDTIFLGAGKTCTLLARNLRDVDRLKVVTTNINSIVELAGSDKVSMLLLGGDIHVGTNYIETLDEYTVRSLEKLYFDKVFITVDGVDMQYGYSINFRLQVMLYEYLLTHSDDFHMMFGRSKLGKRAFTRFCDMKRIRTVITNHDLDRSYMEFFENNGISVHS